MDTALELLDEGGWDAVTVNEIGERAGVSRSMFYSRFPSKEALHLELRDRVIRDLQHSRTATFDQPVHAKADLRERLGIAIERLDEVLSHNGQLLTRFRNDEIMQDSAAAALSPLIVSFRRVLEPAAGEIARDDLHGSFAVCLRICFESLSFARQAPTSIAGALDHFPGFSFNDAEHIRMLRDICHAYLTQPT